MFPQKYKISNVLSALCCLASYHSPVSRNLIVGHLAWRSRHTAGKVEFALQFLLAKPVI